MENFKSVFLETYQSIYCRAKSIMDKEDDVIALMKEVYLLAVESKVTEVNAKSWLTKQTYILGCGKYRKKKAREAEIIELSEHAYETHKTADADKTRELMCETFVELPDLYYTTLFAFYVDKYSIKEIAAITGYSEGVVINRLNYVHKYLSEKLEDYQDEQKVKVQFSVEEVYEALKLWASATKTDSIVMQNLYTNLCKELGLAVEIFTDDDVPSGEEFSVDVESVKEELRAYSVKKGLDKKQIVIVGSIIGGLAVLALVAILILGNREPKEEQKHNQLPIEKQEEEKYQEEAGREDAQEEQQTEQQEEEQTEENTDYILPDSNTRKLTRADLQGLSKEELRFARNEIFARHGVIFGVADLDAYFGAKSWYQPTISLDEFNETSEMTGIEYANLSLISEVEEEIE